MTPIDLLFEASNQSGEAMYNLVGYVFIFKTNLGEIYIHLHSFMFNDIYSIVNHFGIAHHSSYTPSQIPES